MSKIQTHYDNLKVARKAPQEVIRASYKALSQKYHPDKNQGDAQAARIMAIINTAYGVLSDPARRKEHDDWIAAEEWKITWRESVRADDRTRGRADAPVHPAQPAPPPRTRAWRVARDPKWWVALAAGFAAGCAASLLIIEQPTVLPAALASALHAAANPRAEVANSAPAPSPAPQLESVSDSGAVNKVAPAQTSTPPRDLKVLAVTALVVPASAPDCAAELHTLAAPNGEPWPISSAYVAGYPVDNAGDEMQIKIDNTANPVAVFVRLYDLDRRAYARHVYVLAHEALVIDQLVSGKYEVRYQNVAPDGTLAECAARRPHAPRQAVAAP